MRVSTRRRAATDWGRFVQIAYTVVAANTKVLVGSFTLLNAGIGEVVRRTRGLLSIGSDAASGFEEQIGALGFIVVNDLALAAGVASLPGPVTDANDDGWFVWMPFSAQGLLLTATDTSPGSRHRNFEFDSKAMRRVEEGFSVAIIIENASLTDGLTKHLGVSQLTSRT